MCGIAGIVDRKGLREIEPDTLARMGRAIRHRGPDESGQLLQPGLGLISQRLSIVGLADGRQPLYNEDRTVAVVCNGELFDYPERRSELQARGHRLATSTDTEVLVHLWEEHQETFFPYLKGQFAFALVDRARRQLILARDRMGICPLYYAERDGWLIFGSEIKALLASGLVRPEADPLGLDHIFTFFAMGTRRTMFAGVQALLPGHYLTIPLGGGPIKERCYWELDFPDRGQERDGPGLVDDFGQALTRAVELRLRADVPVVSYLSGGVDSSTVAWLASRQLGRPIPTFTIQIRNPRLDETARSLVAARAIGTEPEVLSCGEREIAAGYPALVTSSESPVIDTSSSAIHQLAGLVHSRGYKVALSGEGADEALAGYPWFKVNRPISLLDHTGLGGLLRRVIFRLASPDPWQSQRRRYELMGGYHATSDLYASCALSGYRVYSRAQREAMGGRTACDDLELNLQRMRCWDPLNRSLYLGYKVMLAGLLMTHKGDRPAMAHSVETRFPFLDEDVVALCASVSPRLKLRGWWRDKDLLRCFAGRFLPPAIADRPKHIFRARYSGSFLDPEPAWVSQLLSRESLARTGYFHLKAVRRRPARYDEVGMVGMISTQLWHHLFLGGGLCELPVWSPPD